MKPPLVVRLQLLVLTGLRKKAHIVPFICSHPGENNIEKVIGITDNALKALLFLLHSSWRDAFLSETSASDKVAWLSLHNACVDETPERATMPAVTDISVCHMAASQHTDTAMCSDGLTQRWEQFSERASVVVVKTNRRGTRNHVFWLISYICNQPRHLFFFSFFYLLANRWQCNIKYETGVLKLPSIQIEARKYITIMRHISLILPLKLGNTLVGMKYACWEQMITRGNVHFLEYISGRLYLHTFRQEMFENSRIFFKYQTYQPGCPSSEAIKQTGESTIVIISTQESLIWNTFKY